VQLSNQRPRRLSRTYGEQRAGPFSDLRTEGLSVHRQVKNGELLGNPQQVFDAARGGICSHQQGEEAAPGQLLPKAGSATGDAAGPGRQGQGRLEGFQADQLQALRQSIDAYRAAERTGQLGGTLLYLLHARGCWADPGASSASLGPQIRQDLALRVGHEPQQLLGRSLSSAGDAASSRGHVANIL